MSPALGVVGLASLLAVCGGPDGVSDFDAGPPPPDAGPIRRCADAREVFAFPSPYWIGEEGLVVPNGDAAGDAVRALDWASEIESLDAWPRRPTWVVPLDRDVGTMNPNEAVAYADGEPLDTPMIVEAPTPRTLAVTPRDPFPPEVTEVVLALRDGAAGNARGIPVCLFREPHPDQVSAAEEVGAQVAIRLRIADSTRPLVALQERLAATPALVVESAEAVAIADLGERAPSAEDAPLFQPMALRGVLALPDYRVEGSPMAIDADGAPTAQGTTRPGFVVALPAMGAAPYPVVLYQHGGGQSPLDVFALGGQLAEAGFAFVAIDLPGHGNRVGAMGGGDLDFIDFDSPLNTRENFRQAAADHLAVLNGLAAIEAELEATLGVADALDEDTRYYMGMSLGAVSGSLTTAASRGLTASALFVGGAGFPELMNHGLFAVAAARILRGSEPRPSTMLAVVETIGDGADPLAYALAAEDRSAPPTPILFMQAVDDPLISHAASEQWARAFGARLARPVDHEAVGLVPIDLSARDTFSFEDGGPTATRILVQNPMTEIAPNGRHAGLVLTDYAQRMVTRCFVSARDEGSCEVVDTGFADR